jgi:hypothetical protein
MSEKQTDILTDIESYNANENPLAFNITHKKASSLMPNANCELDEKIHWLLGQIKHLKKLVLQSKNTYKSCVGDDELKNKKFNPISQLLNSNFKQISTNYLALRLEADGTIEESIVQINDELHNEKKFKYLEQKLNHLAIKVQGLTDAKKIFEAKNIATHKSEPIVTTIVLEKKQIEIALLHKDIPIEKNIEDVKTSQKEIRKKSIDKAKPIFVPKEHPEKKESIKVGYSITLLWIGLGLLTCFLMFTFFNKKNAIDADTQTFADVNTMAETLQPEYIKEQKGIDTILSKYDNSNQLLESKLDSSAIQITMLETQKTKVIEADNLKKIDDKSQLKKDLLAKKNAQTLNEKIQQQIPLKVTHPSKTESKKINVTIPTTLSPTKQEAVYFGED